MSTKAASRTTAPAADASKRRALKAVPAAPAAEDAPLTPPAPPAIVPSAPQIFPLSALRRAPENVRHTRVDEDVPALADDIAAHGLLQGPIGYLADATWPEDAGKVMIVGGGRRLQALKLLQERGLIDGTFPVPVLIRDVAEAIELSLAENLQQRTMSPVDEFLAFRALMETGSNSPADLAKRFGFTERVVKQRLQLGKLDEDILAALAAREITLDAAKAYASTSDPHVQREVFKRQKKQPAERAHSAAGIRYAIANDTKTEEWPLYRYIGAAAYERAGGGYEEGLFDLDQAAAGKRRLDNGFAVVTKAHEHIDFQLLRLQREWEDELEIPGQIAGFVKVKDLTWGRNSYAYQGLDKQAPDGFAWVGNDYSPQSVDRMLRTIRNNRILVKLPVGIDDDGRLIRIPKGFFVPKDQKQAVDAKGPQPAYRPVTPEERAAQDREAGIERWARRLAVGPFTGTPLEGRAYFGYYTREATIDGVKGWRVELEVFVTEAEVAARRDAAADRYDRELAEKAAAEQARKQREADAAKRQAELAALDPPAVVVIDGEPWIRADDGMYAPFGDADDEMDDGIEDWPALLEHFGPVDIESTWPTRESFDAAMRAAGADLEGAGA